MGTVQPNVLGSTPIVNNSPPPEGQYAVLLSFPFSAAGWTSAQQLQLNAPGGGIALSQVASILIDNTGSLIPLAVIHGAMSTTTHCPAGMAMLVPSFSNRAPYQLIVSLASPPPAGVTMTPTITLFNYANNTAQWGLAQSQGATELCADVTEISGNGTTTVVAAPPTGYWILYTLDFAIEFAISTATSGSAYCLFTCSVAGTTLFQNEPAYNSTASNVLVQGVDLSWPVSLTWPNGFLCPEGAAVELVVSGYTNIGAVTYRLNISGVNAP